MKRFIFPSSQISGLCAIERQPIEDKRGYLERLFCSKEFEGLCQDEPIRQINHTLTRLRGAVRGLHFQYPPYADMKIISCLKGKIFDVAVDLRRGSPTFLQHFSQELSEANRLTAVIPKGFAHGFQTLTPNCELIYFHTADYNADAEAGLNALDPCLGIQWPIKITVRSKRDQEHPMLTDGFVGIEVL